MARLRYLVNAAQESPQPTRLPRQAIARQYEHVPVQSMASKVAYRRVQTTIAGLKAADLVGLQRAVGNRLVQRTRAASAAATVQRMSIKERNSLNADDYGQAIHNGTTRTGYHLFTIWHKTDKKLNIQVHWHPISAKFPKESWKVRWADESTGNQDALEWMKVNIRATQQGTLVALASMQQGGAEYEAQFPSL